MEQLNIHTNSGSVTVALKSNSELSAKLLDEDIVKVFFESKEYVDLQIGNYVDVFNSRYWINTVPIVRKLSSNLFDYEVVFESAIYDLSKAAFLDTDATGIHMSHEFYLFGDLQRYASVIQNNLDRVFGSGIWIVEVFGLQADKVKNLSFSESNCLQALKKLCEEFSCEYEVITASGAHTIRIRQMVGGGGALSFAYGKGNGLYDIKRTIASSNNLTTRLFAFGGSRNLGPNYRNYSTRLKLPGSVSGTPDIAVVVEDHELVSGYWYIYGYTTASNVKLQIKLSQSSSWQDYGETMPGAVFNESYVSYPALINPVAVRLKAWSIVGKNVYSDGTSDGWNVQVSGESYIDNAAAIARYGVIERVVIFDDIVPEREGEVTGLSDTVFRFVDSSMFNLNEVDSSGNPVFIIGGIDPKLSFKTGNLAGYEFVIANFDSATKTFTLQKFVDERGTLFPNPDNSAFQIQPGDKYVLIDIMLPQSYIDDAELRLLSEAENWLGKYSNDQVLYELSIDEMFAKQGALLFGVGDAIGILDDDLGVNEQIRIVEVRRNLVREFAFVLKLANSTYLAKTRRVKQGKVNAATQLKSGGMQPNWNEHDPLSPAFIKNKPDLDAIADKHLSFPVSNKLFEVINHNLGKNPSVSVVDTDNETTIADIEYIDIDTVKISFTDFFTGTIIFN